MVLNLKLNKRIMFGENYYTQPVFLLIGHKYFIDYLWSYFVQFVILNSLLIDDSLVGG